MKHWRNINWKWKCTKARTKKRSERRNVWLNISSKCSHQRLLGDLKWARLHRYRFFAFSLVSLSFSYSPVHIASDFPLYFLDVVSVCFAFICIHLNFVFCVLNARNRLTMYFFFFARIMHEPPILPPNNCGPSRQLDCSDTKVKTQEVTTSW